MMTDQTLVTVIIPCYNVAAFIQKAVASIIDQTFTNLEIILVDDASTDNTLEICRSFKDERIKVLEFSQNTRKIEAVNRALAIASGDYIAFQDADDWSEASRLEKQLQQFKKDPGLGICFTGYCYSGDKKGVNGSIALTDEELKDEFLSFGNKKNVHFQPTICATMMVRKDIIQQLGGYHPYFAGRVGEDIYMVYQILKEHKGTTVNEVLYNYHIRVDSLSGLQQSGYNARAAYSWELLDEIIRFNKDHVLDIMDDTNASELKELELVACEKALLKSIRENNRITSAYKDSSSYKLGSLFLWPLRILKKIRG